MKNDFENQNFEMLEVAAVNSARIVEILIYEKKDEHCASGIKSRSNFPLAISFQYWKFI